MPHAVPDTPASAAPLDASVLYVEDDSFALRANAKLLGKMVSTLHTAQNGQEGLLVFSRHDPDIVITDVLMPKMDGLEMISHIRGMKPDVQVIVATSFDEPNFLHRAIRVGVDDYVLKPIDGSALRFALEKCYRRLCDRRRSTEHQRFAELMLGGLPHPAMLIDRDHQTVVTANPYAMELGFTPGVSCHGPLFPSSLASPNPLEDAFTPKPYSPSTIREAAAFDRVWDISLIPVSVSTLLLFAVDVTEHNRLQRLREDVERMVHHDMKAPLSGIIGMAQMLLDPGDLLDARTCAQSILDGSRHILTMLDLSLDLFKMEEGIYRPAKTTFDLAGMLMRLEREFTSLTKERTLRILYRLDNAPWDLQQPCPFHSEPRLAHTLLGNLIQNALEAAPRESDVLINVFRDTPAIIEVRNQGAVPEEIRSRFFDRYATWGKPHGTGLGTYNARLMARTLGGDITYSTSEETGTSLMVTLPGAYVSNPDSDSDTEVDRLLPVE